MPRREAYVFALVLPHDLNEIHSADDIVSVVQHWELDALANSLASGEVDNSIKPERRAQSQLLPAPFPTSSGLGIRAQPRS